MRTFIRLFGPGLLVTVLAFAVAALLVAGFGVDWPWHTIALFVLAGGGLLILTLLIQPGSSPSAPAGYAGGYDTQDAFIELMGRETAGTVTEHRPSVGSIEALTNMLPPAIAFFALVLYYGLS
jgi:hypothetical protein